MLRKNRRLVSAERNGFQITPLVLGAEEWWNGRRGDSSRRWKCGYAAGLCCARKGKRILAAFGDAHRLEDKTIHLDQR